MSVHVHLFVSMIEFDKWVMNIFNHEELLQHGCFHSVEWHKDVLKYAGNETFDFGLFLQQD